MIIISNFADRMIAAGKAKKSNLIAGLDPQLHYVPQHIRDDAVKENGPSTEAVARAYVCFNMAIIDAVLEYVVAIKLQIAFYEMYGHWGIWAHEMTLQYGRKQGLEVITDGKRNDGGDTAEAYADGHIGMIPMPTYNPNGPSGIKRTVSPIRTDALTVTPYIGDDCVERFVKRVKEFGTGIFIVDKTSFIPNSRVEELQTVSGLKVWQEVALMAEKWSVGTEGSGGYRNVGVVFGATKDEDAPWMRTNIPKLLKLIPGVGGQGGTPDGAVAVLNDDGLGGYINDSRNLAFAFRRVEKFRRNDEQFASASHEYTRELHTQVGEAMKRANKYPF